ncbi:hypothetical protein D3C87_1695190 [compost metagenome]
MNARRNDDAVADPDVVTDDGVAVTGRARGVGRSSRIAQTLQAKRVGGEAVHGVVARCDGDVAADRTIASDFHALPDHAARVHVGSVAHGDAGKNLHPIQLNTGLKGEGCRN